MGRLKARNASSLLRDPKFAGAFYALGEKRRVLLPIYFGDRIWHLIYFMSPEKSATIQILLDFILLRMVVVFILSQLRVMHKYGHVACTFLLGVER